MNRQLDRHTWRQYDHRLAALRLASSLSDLTVSRLHALGWRASTSLQAGLAKTYADFLDNHAAALSR